MIIDGVQTVADSKAIVGLYIFTSNTNASYTYLEMSGKTFLLCVVTDSLIHACYFHLNIPGTQIEDLA